MAISSLDMVGQEIDTYRILEMLGQGGMGVVYKAVDTSLDKVVALKVMHRMLVADERFVRRFKSEAKALGRLHHPHIVDVYAFRHIDAHLFIVMQYIDGGTLADLIRRRGPIPWKEAVPLITAMLEAIDFAHSKKVIHRDIKPRNILLTRAGVAKMTDFGLAKIQEIGTATLALTRTGMTGGTLYYMPPEQLEGLANVDLRGDIYALGMTFYEMLAGKSPFEGLSSEFAVLKAIDAHDFPSLDQVNAGVPKPLVEIIMRAVEHNPDERFQTGHAMQAALQQWLAHPAPDDTVLARPAPTGEGVRPAPAKSEEGGSAPDPGASLLDTVLEQDGRAPAASDRGAVASRGGHVPDPATAPTEHRTPPPIVTPSSGEAAPARSRTLRRVVLGGLLLVLAGVLYLVLPALFASGPVAGERATVTIHTVPAGAGVSINGQPAGRSPLNDYEVSAGTLAVRLEEAGFLPLDTTMTVDAAETRVFAFTLTPEPDTAATTLPVETATLVITSQPSGADVLLDGTRLGRTPYRADNLEARTYRLLLRMNGYASYEQSVTLDPQQPKTVAANLVARMGTLRIVVRPFGDIYINGERIATDTFQPYVAELPYGAYRVRVTHRDFGSWEKQIRIDQASQEVLFDLNQQFKVLITSEPSVAEIIVDGMATGQYTPGQVTVRPGQHTFEVRKPGYVLDGTARRVTVESQRIEDGIRFTLTKAQ